MSSKSRARTLRKASINLLLALVGAALVLSACSTSPAPVSSRPPPPGQRINHYIVSAGDTLYLIAWRFELAPERLAAINGLSPPYTLRVGQRLSLDISQRSRAPSGNKYHTVSRGETLYGIARYYQLPVDQLALANGLGPPYVLRIGQRLSLDLSRRAAAPVKASSSWKKPSSTGKAGSAGKVRGSSGSATTAKLPTGALKWRWPVKGSITRFFDSNRVFKGINIQSRAGYAVRTTAPGVVVYAGDGLRGYGRLVIIKHSEVYLSAYAHNRKILVKEGASVKSGTKISEVGGSSGNPGRLYFEIRKSGKPVDPVRLLPTQ